MATLNVNGKQVSVDVEPDMPLLWVLRDELGLTGTKYGCGIAMCGACTVQLDGQPVRSCVMPVSAVEGKKITTIEALSKDGTHPVQKAWVQLQVPQCGYCQSGMIMAAAALLASNRKPSRRRYRRGHDQHLPLRDLRAGARGHPPGGEIHLTEVPMAHSISTDRRDFLVKTAALTGGLALGVRLPISAQAAESAAQGPEVTHWIVIQPDDTVVVRIARSELGQGTFTGLAMLAAEELECDWSKVRPEYADVNEHVRRDRIFGSMSTGGSRGIRDSQDYMRKAGAAAREMLVAAAAQQWGVPASECSVAKGVITHEDGHRATTFGKVADAAAKLPSAQGGQAQGPEAVEAHRHLAGALRHTRQDHRQADLRRRRAPARPAARVDRAVPGIRRQAQELR